MEKSAQRWRIVDVCTPPYDAGKQADTNLANNGCCVHADAHTAVYIVGIVAGSKSNIKK